MRKSRQNNFLNVVWVEYLNINLWCWILLTVNREPSIRINVPLKIDYLYGTVMGTVWFLRRNQECKIKGNNQSIGSKNRGLCPIRKLSQYFQVSWRFIFISFLGNIWHEIYSLWDGGLIEYISDLWNIVDFTANMFFLAWIFLRATAWCIVQVCLVNIKRPFRWEAL